MARYRHVIGFLFILSDVVSSSNITQDSLQPPRSCDVGDVSENECIKCICTSNSVYTCTSLNCTNHSKENPKEFKLLEDSQMPLKLQTCLPNTVYVHGTVKCICNIKGYWPHKHCDEIFNSLAPGNITKLTCELNTYVIIDCNVCRCSPSGNIDKERCTTNICDKYQVINSRRGQTSSEFYGSCEPANWYSLAPCQFCFCVSKNSLICNNGHVSKKKLILGPYGFTVCGKDIIHNAIDLIPQNKDMTVLRNDQGHNLKNNSLTTKNLEAKEINDTTIGVSKDNTFQIEDVIEKKQVEYRKSGKEKEGKFAPQYRAFTRMTFGDENTNEETNSENEIAIEFLNQDSKLKEVTSPTEANGIIYSWPRARDKSKKKIILKNPLKRSHTLIISLPMVINKVFKMALRKSMVSLTANTDCVPGTSSKVKCNTCFCMKNNKLLCTNNPCQ